MQRTIESKSKALVLPLILALLSFFLANRPLPELDLGWHLATGLWILDTGQLPLADPFGAQASLWVAYSWVFEVLLAQVYRAFGFFGLQCLQFFLVWALLQAYVQFYRTCAEASTIRELFSLGLAVLLVSPFLYLRPQTVSLLFLLLTLHFLRCRHPSKVYVSCIFLMTVLWANIHVYWVFVPLLLCAKALVSFNVKQAAWGLLFVLAGAISPYGLLSLDVVFQYVFRHETADQLILEFSRLGSNHGIYWYLSIALILLMVLLTLLRRQYGRVFETGLSFSTAILALTKVKYLSLFSVGILLFFGQQEQPSESRSWQDCVRELGASALLLLAVLSIAVLLNQHSPAISARQQHLEQVVKSIADTKSFVVLNHFNDGGAIALYSYLHGLRVKTFIDGRSLVVGPRRLTEFQRLSNADDASCSILQTHALPLAIAERGTWLARLLQDSPCASPWTQVFECGNWVLFKHADHVTDLRLASTNCSLGTFNRN